jgi:N-succinyldiaminopimelate aminotransferase
MLFSDDVYEHMVFDNNKMIRVATLPDMWDRTITIGQFYKFNLHESRKTVLHITK